MQQSSFDLSSFATVPVDRTLEDANATQQVRYRVQLSNGDPAQTFPSTGSQTVTAVGPHTADVTVRALRPGDRMTANEPLPGPSDTEPSAMIQSDAPEVRALAGQVHPPATDAWSIAMATEQFVYRALTRKDFSTAFASAADVARHRQGDCTEHAVLTAALCRAQGVPARVLIGLVYVGSKQGFAFHMWNEVWVDGQWIPIDGTLGYGGIPATHLVISRSSLETSDPFSAFLPVLNVMGQLSIQILEVQR
jgi:transglutaminase-like putative cysteine protease